MAITQIYGFQNFGDYLDRNIADITPFGKLPFHNNNPYEGSARAFWKFVRFKERVWFFGDWGTYYNLSSTGNPRALTASTRTPSFNFPTGAVYGDHVSDSSVNRFTMGVRFWWPSTDTTSSSQSSPGSRPLFVVRLLTHGGDTTSSGLILLRRDETPEVKDVVFYFEWQIDFELGVIKRWLDGVRMSDISPNNTYIDRQTWENMFIHIGFKYVSTNTNGWGYWAKYGVNDMYFIADTSHLNDGLPSGRLGPIEVEALKPKNVILPETWENETAKDPAAFLAETVNKVNMRDEKGIITDEAGEKAVVEFEEPEFREGEILYCEFEAYGYRNFGDNVALKTQMKQGEGSDDPKHHEVEPERLRTGERTIFPGKFHKPLDGETWDEQKLGQIKLELWSTKPE